MDDTTGHDTLRLARLREVFEDDREAILETLRECSTYVRRSLADLTIALEANDAAGVRSAAHSIKGSCGNVGALACERAATAIESDARNGSLPYNAEPLRRLVEDFDLAVARYAQSDAP